ncbi:hypothetical protein BXZ70DRAFT_1035175 [Cristinia sonorae]|uniref:GmrSD restriction endonucleases N-terminal domain-containing protein n=1 Tax=Cristinia sonorae TaxID=1940300 RepID=A0A8K0XMQ9_9AGAR|nr:hypothetical protein BXZ70DRAFT_1035175 [Cristinia sonorae]
MPRAQNQQEDDGTDDELDYSDDENIHIGDILSNPAKMSTLTTQQLHAMIHEGEIDLNPPYQREVVWPVDKQKKLLDSICRDFYIPPLLLASRMDRGHRVYRCVDGKQRLTSIQMFFDGLIPYQDPKTKKLWYCGKSHKVKRLQVPDEWKKKFEKKELLVGLSATQEHEMFARVQLGMSLSHAEKLQAISCERSTWINKLDAMYFLADDGIPRHLDINLKRGQNFQLLVQLAFYCQNIPETPFASGPKLEQWLTSPEALDEAFKQDITTVLRDFLTIASNRKLSRGFTDITQRVAPAEFVFIGILLYVLSDCTKEEKAREIYTLRKSIREVYPDVRSRNDIVRTLWELIANVSDKYDCQLDWEVSAPPKNRKKRKADDDDDDDEESGGRAKRGRTRA